MKGCSRLMNIPHSVTEKSWYFPSMGVRATSHPHLVVAVPKRDNSGWQTAAMRLTDGIAGSVWQTACNFDTVNRPERILYHSLDFDCCLVASSTVYVKNHSTNQDPEWFYHCE